MALKTGQDYAESLRKLKPRVYALGQEIKSVADHPLTRPHVNSAAMTYEIAHNPLHEGITTATSHLTGARINRFTHIHMCTGDLVAKVKVLRALGQITGTCFQRCVGWDALNALYSVTYEMDRKAGTDYHRRLTQFLAYVQDNDLMSDGGMTDPKGDRSLPPSKQPDPDVYLRVVERNTQGIVVRGAKAHQTGAVNSHEIIVMPTVAMGAGDSEYAVSFAVPADAKGVVHIFGRQANDGRRLEGGDGIDLGNARYGTVGGEALIIFEDVFVPHERVFMCGEYEFSGMLVDRFASLHRQNYGACKGGVADVLIGATSLMAEYNGAGKASHVRDKLTEMVHLAETAYAGSVACSAEGIPTASGAYLPDPLLANTVKLNITRSVYELARLSHDIAGGILATLPSEMDLRGPWGEHLDKYLRGAAAGNAVDRMRVVRLIEAMTSPNCLVECMHGAGSPQAQRIQILRQARLDQKQALAKRIAGVDM